MKTQTIYHLGIDCSVEAHKALTRRLSRLKSTKEVSFGGTYRQEPSLCQVHIDTTKTESELDHWLWNTKGIDYIGVFER